MRKLYLLISFVAFLLNANSQSGIQDMSFGVNGLAKVNFGTDYPQSSHIVKKIFPQADGSFYLLVNINNESVLTRYSSNGTRDLSYGIDGFSVPVGVLGSDAVYHNNKIIIVGQVYSGNGYSFGVARFNMNGTLDATFGNSGKVITSFDPVDGDYFYANAQSVTVYNNKIIVGGYANTNNGNEFVLVCYNIDGSLNALFGGNGKISTPFLYTYTINGNTYTQSGAIGRSVKIQGDKIILAGSSASYTTGWGSNSNFALARYNLDGSLDETFGELGKVITPFNYTFTYNGTEYTISQAQVSAATIQNDKIIIAGYTYQDGSFAVARYNNDGSLDESFGSGGKVSTSFGDLSTNNNTYTTANASCIEFSENKIVVAGYVFSYGTNSYRYNFALARYQNDGSLDGTFGTNGKVITQFDYSSNPYSYAFASAAALNNGQLVIGGYLSPAFGGGGSYLILSQYSANGSLDQTFGTNGKVKDFLNVGFSWFVKTITQQDGKIVAVGTAYKGSDGYFSKYVFAIARFNSDGSPDPTFGDGGKVITSFDYTYPENNINYTRSDAQASSVAVIDDKIVVGGTADSYENNIWKRCFAIVRYNSNGTLDNSFGSAGKVLTPFDYTYDGNTSSYANASSLIIHENKILVAGNAHKSENNYGKDCFAIARYNYNGSLDESFGIGGKMTTPFDFEIGGNIQSQAYASSLFMQNDKIVVTGEAVTSYSHHYNNSFALARYNNNGTLDASFGNNGKVVTAFDFDFNGNTQSLAYSAAAAAYGDKIILIGQAATEFVIGYGFCHSFALARYNNNGTLDETFGSNGKVLTPFNAEIMISDGSMQTVSSAWGSSVDVRNSRITVAGSAITSAGYDLALARYDCNGALDEDFGVVGKVTTNVISYYPEYSFMTEHKIYSAGSSFNFGTIATFSLEPPPALVIYYQDSDGDGFGSPSVSQQTCSQPQGYVTNNTDCNDDDDTIYPGAPEICDGKDNDCDGNIDGAFSITSFTPLSATVGSSVTIQGANFQNGNSTIYFGAVKAQINSISETSIDVTVPAGATYDHISVTSGDCHLTAYSNKKFTPIFDCNTPLNTNAFASKVDFATSTQPQFTTITDFDGDGKPDLGLTQNYLTVFKNTSTNSVINSGTLASSFDLNSGQVPYGIESADIDGDGKKDILVASMNSNIFSVYRNISTSGNLTNGSFAPRVNFTTVTNPSGIAVGDIDLDGKPDVVVTNSQEPYSVSVFRNTSTVGNISFAAKVDLALDGQSYFIKMADLDDDGRPEIIAINTFVSSTIQIFRNLSNPGTIDASSFAAPVSLSTGSSARQPDIADLDGDGKLDIIAPNQDNNNFSVYRNVSTTGTISFAPRVNVSAGSNPISAKCGDIDGDGKVDVVIANIAGHTISVYKNNSTSGTLSFGAAFIFSTGVSPYSANIADLDSDGKPEVIVANYAGKTISIFKNQINALAAPIITSTEVNPICPGTTTTLGTTIEYASYLWSTGATTPSINVGEGSYTVTVTDENGCQNSSTYIVTESDNVFPTIQCLQNKYVNVSPGLCSSTVAFEAAVTDNCSVAVNYYLNYGQQNQTEIISPYVFPVGTKVVTVIATDAGNNQATCTFSVTVVDNEPPVIPATPPDVIVNTDPGQCTASNVILGGLNASDNCQIIAEIHNAPSVFPIGTTIVKRTVYDAEGNLATVNQNVIVVDNQSPTVVILPPNITVNTNPGQCSASNVSLGNVSFTDNCPGTSVTNNAPPVYPKGMTTVKWTATDASGNTTTISQTVTVVDNEAPYLVCPSNIIVNNNPGQCGKQVFYNINFGDNCPGGSVWTNAGSGSFFAVGVNTVNLIATDGSGNQTSCSFTVTVIDNESPEITSCPSNQTLCYVASGTYSISPLTATDNCIVSSVSYVITGATSRNGNSSNASGTFNPGTSAINWTVTDGSGNTSTCSTTIVIDKVDVTIPDVFPANINASIGSPNTIYVGYGGSSVTLTAQVSSTANPNSYTYKWTIGSPGGPSIGTGPTLTVSPTATTVYYVSIKDAYDCKPLYQVTKHINVVDIRCGNGKIYVCKFKNGAYTTNCIQATTNNVNNLGAGSYLGQCTSQLITTKQPAVDEVKPIDGFTVDVYPNPSASSFNVTVQSPDVKEKIQLKVINIAGQMIETKNINSGQTLRLGENYRSGSYVIQAIQGNQRKTIKVIKLSD